MWTRAEIKSKAKDVLRKSYWKAFAVSLIIGFAGGNYNGGGSSSWRTSSDNFSESGLGYGFDLAIFLGVLILIMIIAVFAIAFRIFLGFHLEVGGRKYFIQSTGEDVNMSYLGYAFTKERYWDVLKTMLWRGFLNFLWFLLLIIPGIVKFYAYRMVPYILADNPNIGYKRAVELSQQMTDGEKFNIFVLDLSFLGWYILGTLALFVGVLFVRPYDNATNAELYLVLRQNALNKGLCTLQELNLNNPQLSIEY